MASLLPIASGKGGVGKSVIAANLGVALAQAGRTVVLVDLDLGGSNLHTFLGVRNRAAGIGAFVWKAERRLGDLLTDTGQERLWLVAGDGLLPGTANLEWFVKQRILKELSRLPADFVILDLGAGSSYNVVDFFLSSAGGMVVIRPEVTSILNAYSFLKTACFRTLVRSFPEKSEGRHAVLDFAKMKTEGSGVSFLEFARELSLRFPEGGSAALNAISGLRPRVVMNLGGSGGAAADDARLGYRLREIAARNLGLSVEFVGYLPDDPAVPRSLAARIPLVSLDPDSPFSRGMRAIAGRISGAGHRASLALEEGEATLESLMDETRG
ncbi:MAG TPA: P-loop NTPase [Rectinemataceae bacterium]|nr:P-loop NTPase [Rectinemataceae bacterium]